MPRLIATIFHVTDMHLYVDASGELRERPPTRSARLISRIAKKVSLPRASRLASGVLWQNELALQRFREILPELLSHERDEAPADTPILVLQGGDVEALGSAAPKDVNSYAAFPSYQFVHEELVGPEPWIDIFGNHDTWPGTYPPMRWRHDVINRERVKTIPGLEGPWPGTIPKVYGETTGVPVVVVRLNTISRTILEESRASGRVNDHPPAGADLQQVLSEIESAFADWRNKRAVRILLMHHPPHLFRATNRKEFTTGQLVGKKELARCLSESRVQVVVAGHRHKLDPDEGVEGLTPEMELQPPLRSPTVQLVAESPTQDIGKEKSRLRDATRRSFSRYRLFEDGDRIAIHRVIFEYADEDGAFVKQPSSAVFEDIPLE